MIKKEHLNHCDTYYRESRNLLLASRDFLESGNVKAAAQVLGSARIKIDGLAAYLRLITEPENISISPVITPDQQDLKL